MWEIYKNNYLVVEKNDNPVKAYNLKQGQSTITYSLTDSVKVPALRDFNDGNHKYYIKSEDNYILETWNSLKTYFGSGRQDGARNSLVNNKLNYYELVEQPIGVYYSVTDPYYYKDNYNNWLRETAFRINTNDVGAIYENNELVQKSRYFTINPTKIGNLKLFSDGIYYSDTNGTIATNYSNTLYEKIGRYVVSDDLNIYDIGAEWNEEIVPKPSTVKVGTRNIVWKAVELPELSENFNTLLGLILRINNKLLSEDTKTRDLNTVQGCINKINDILDKFHQLVPAEIAMVDAYGRVHSGDWDSKQKSGYSNIGKPSADVAIPAGDPVAADNERWLKLTTTSGTSSNDYKPHIKLEHTFKAAEDTNTTADKNVANSGDGLNKGNDDALKLYTPIVDNMGHVVGKNTETVTLPYGFKTITTGAASNAITDGAGNTAAVNLVAENTKDTLTISPSNKWIRIAGTANSDSFTIGHQVNSIDEVASTATDLNDNSTDVINIPDFTYDEAGHLTAKKTHNYTLPYNFKTITVGNESNVQNVLAHASGSVIADQVYDTLTLNEGNMWISLAADATNDVINIGHAAGLTASTVGDSQNQSPKFGDTFQALQVGRDIAGHVTTLSAHTVELPTPSLAVAVNPQTQNPQVGNIVTELNLVADEGAFTYNKDYVGNLALTGYAQTANSIASMPQATDSINDAISKLSYVLNNSTVTVNDRITAVDNRMTQWLQNAAGLADVWGVQAGISAFDNGSLSNSVKYATLAISGMQDAAMQAVLTYGTPQYTIEDGGVKLAVAGKYRIQGSLVVQYNRNCDAIKIAIYKKGITDSAPKMISSITETGTFTDESDNTMLSGVFGISPKIVQLDANDIIYLGAYKATENGMVTWAENNFGNYLLIEKVDGINTTNQNNGGGE